MSIFYFCSLYLVSDIPDGHNITAKMMDNILPFLPCVVNAVRPQTEREREKKAGRYFIWKTVLTTNADHK